MLFYLTLFLRDIYCILTSASIHLYHVRLSYVIKGCTVLYLLALDGWVLKQFLFGWLTRTFGFCLLCDCLYKRSQKVRLLLLLFSAAERRWKRNMVSLMWVTVVSFLLQSWCVCQSLRPGQPPAADAIRLQSRRRQERRCDC